MWKGFYLYGDTSIFNDMAVFHILVTCTAYGFYCLRNNVLWQKFNTVKLAGNDKNESAHIIAMVGAYGLSSTYLIIAPIINLLVGTLNIWAAGNAT